MNPDAKQYSENILVGGLEAGGTRFNCVIGYSNGDIIARRTFPTTNPQETLARVSDFFKESVSVHGPLQALGVAHFGPVEINKAAENYGKILATTKPGWSHTNIVGYFSGIFDVPIAFQSDVNAAALGEHHFGAAEGCDNFVYITVGTGIGGGVYVNGALLNDRSHPEIGHMLVPHDLAQDSFTGSCPFHADCLEGLASGPAIKARWGRSAEGLEPDHPAWELEAQYLAILCANLTYCYAPEKIIMGGGVMHQKHLFPLIRQYFMSQIQGYRSPFKAATIDKYIVPSRLEGEAATRGALILAHQAHVMSLK
ncbi:Fructokinase [hydrothermal vent metagenome]|uniref:fructokinase n=1 Tax=hydrothermal vent metagenome TaxID=652676 RepID=A0A3B0R2Z9_9ZZZZ